MLRPSAAPRWKIATRIFLRGEGPSAAYRARSSHSGAVPAPTIASAELRTKNLRVVIVSSESLLLEVEGAQRDALRRLRAIHFDSENLVVYQRDAEVHARQQAGRVQPLLAGV